MLLCVVVCSENYPAVWVQALSYFASRPDCEEFVKKVLTGTCRVFPSVFFVSLVSVPSCPYVRNVVSASLCPALFSFTAIESRNVVSPLLVIQILARNSGATLGTVRDYIVRKLEADEVALRDVRAVL